MKNSDCHSTELRSTKRSGDEKKSLLNRINRISGQLNGIRRMVEDDAYCVDVLMQCTAVNKALEALEREVFSSHLHSCVARDIKEGKDEVLDETMDIVERLMR